MPEKLPLYLTTFLAVVLLSAAALALALGKSPVTMMAFAFFGFVTGIIRVYLGRM